MGALWVFMWEKYEVIYKIDYRVILSVMGQSKVIQGWNKFMDFNGAIDSINERKEESMHFGRLIIIFGSIIDITKKVPSFVSLVASIVFNNSSTEWNMWSAESNDSETIFIKPN